MESEEVPNWKKHRDILEEKGIDFDKIIEIRKHFHKHPEGAFNEFETQKKLKEVLTGFGIEESDIKTCAETGLVVDIVGTGEETGEGECNWLAFRADIDALKMKEETGLEYSSVTDHAHMCGHDGHMATLLATTQFWVKHREKIPKNKKIRLLFQPAEEGPGGAEPMIKEGWMEGVDEVYGYHNVPFGVEGSVTCCQGPFMAGVIIIKIEVIGQGGHGSEPAKSIDPITAACHLHTAFHTIKSRSVMNKDVVAFTICEFTSGSTYNVIPRTAFMQGTIRYFDKEVKNKVVERIKLLTQTICEGFNCKYNLEILEQYPPLINSDKQTQIVTDLAKSELGEEYVNTKNSLPWFASEDFSYFLFEKPGMYIGLNNVKPGEDPLSLHSSYMNFNDNIISTGAYFNIKISENRLGVKLL